MNSDTVIQFYDINMSLIHVFALINNPLINNQSPVKSSAVLWNVTLYILKLHDAWRHSGSFRYVEMSELNLKLRYKAVQS